MFSLPSKNDMFYHDTNQKLAVIMREDILTKIPRNGNSFFKTSRFLKPWNRNDQKQAPPIEVVTCFIQTGDRVLILQRNRKDAQFGLWGIPGGKLGKGESVLEGLIREIQEETGYQLKASDFTYLDSALSKTATDGAYGLHLFHARVNQMHLMIDSQEHTAAKWVTLNEFIKLPLLHAQLEAFQFVEQQLKQAMAG
jgi:8-oxo-dGTP pyrophosphatase MutT (NUDIX family)